MLLRNAASFALVASLLGAPAIAAADTTAPVAAQVESTQAPVKAASATESNSYAQREAKDSKVADYRGGNTVVIAMSGGAFILLLFLLLLL